MQGQKDVILGGGYIERMNVPCGGNESAALLDVYLDAKEAVLAQGFAWEIDWQAERRLDRIGESEFLRESLRLRG